MMMISTACYSKNDELSLKSVSKYSPQRKQVALPTKLVFHLTLSSASIFAKNESKVQ